MRHRTFKQQIQSQYTPRRAWDSIAVGDFNGDGKAGLVLMTDDAGDCLSVFMSNGNGTFGDPLKNLVG